MESNDRPCEFEISFVVVDILAIFNFFFSRPQIHSTGAIPSSLHQKVKFISANKLITIIAEEDTPLPASTMVPFIDTQQLDTVSRYHSFEFVTGNYISEGGIFLELKLS